MTTIPHFQRDHLPDSTQASLNFPDSTWFRSQASFYSFPSPAEVRALNPLDRSGVARYEDVGLVVKYGPSVSIAEAICLWVVRKVLQNQVPVPEVYGWKRDGRDVFIYMQLVPGPTLLESWPSLSYEDRLSVCNDLRQMITQLRTIGTDQTPLLIGSVTGGYPLDYVVQGEPSLRSFPSPMEFHDWLSWLWRRKIEDPQTVPDLWRPLLPDDANVVFTHGDLHRRNIIITSTSPVRVAALLDWEQSGWYPDYWEYCKAMFTASDAEDWRGNGWIDMILTPNTGALEAFDFITGAIGAW
ncbi:kinase-like domain-containing protein [Lophiotrema nucula]|uniref:Kinase-like domain-containing protein n=1 Tax=Lophiotrema nucula TaxID=690887 RepID=A0A6A5YX68_9PLEO|nr:kinase-like domain-containing protein [Lophiotrema nucula]